MSSMKASATSAVASGVCLANSLIQAVACSPAAMEPISEVMRACRASEPSPACSMLPMPARMASIPRVARPMAASRLT
ncbi:hypothetical protein D3C80_1861490 [compost metagenome]